VSSSANPRAVRLTRRSILTAAEERLLQPLAHGCARPGAQGETMHVNEVMSRSPRTCRIDDSADAAVRVMWEQDCGAVPVLDHEGRVAGIVTDRDICIATYFQSAPPSALRVADIMSRDVCTCRTSDAVTDAEQAMRQRQVRRLPVIDERQVLVGMLSVSDLAQSAKHAGRLRASGGDGVDLLQTVTAVSEPRQRRVPPAV
jgi:CBS-domain-containing membrane protein